MTTGPQDCNVPTDGETIDTTLAVAGMTIFDTLLVTDTETRPIIAATWTPPTNPYVTGVQFQYYPDILTPPISTTAPQSPSAGTWQTSDGVAYSGVYKVRYRAVGARAFGSWSGYTTVTMDDAPGGTPPVSPDDPVSVGSFVSFELFTTGVRSATVGLLWTDPSDSTIFYRVRWKRSTDTVYQYVDFDEAISVTIIGAPCLYVTVEGIPTDATINVSLQAVSKADHSLVSNWVDASDVDTTPSTSIPTPSTFEWGCSGVTVTSDDGLTQFGQITVTGAVNGTNLPQISGITIRFRRHGTSTWTSKETHLKAETKFEFTNLLPSTSYDIAIAYIAFETSGTELVFSDVTTGVLTVPGGAPPDSSILVDSVGSGADSLTITWDGTISIECWGASGAIGDDYVKHDISGDITTPAGTPGGGAYSKSVVVVAPGDVFDFGSGVVGAGDSGCTGPGGLSMTAGGGGDSSADAMGSIDGGGGTASGGNDTNTNGADAGGDGSSNGRVLIIKTA